MIFKRSYLRCLASAAFILGMLWLAATIGLAGEPWSLRALSITSPKPRETANESVDRRQEGFVVTGDGIHISYQVIGNGPETIVIPGRLFLTSCAQATGRSRTTFPFT